MTTRFRNRLPLCRALITGLVLAALTGCGDSNSSIRDRWAYYTLRDVQTEMPYLLDRVWNRRREYTQAEMLAVRPGGDQTLLIARAVRNPVYNDVAQRDEQVSRTFVIALDEPAKAGKTYRITAENGRLIEGTTFRPAWRPYRGLEGEVTVLGVSDNAIRAAVRVTGLTLEMADPDRALRGVFTFKTATGAEPELQQAQVNFLGEISMELPRLESAQ